MRLTRRRKAMSDKHHLSRKPLSRFIISTAWYLALYRVLKKQAEGIEQAGASHQLLQTEKRGKSR